MGAGGETPSPVRRVVLGAAALVVAVAVIAASLQRNAPPSPAEIRFGPALARVVFHDGNWDLSRADLLEWVETSGQGVFHYFGGFSVDGFTLHVRAGRGDGVSGGRTRYVRGPEILLRVGRAARRASLADDWVLPHEMIHIAFPMIEDAPDWMDEGLATYVEPLARILAGTQSPERMWYELMRDMPQGLPQAGDRGLNLTRTWGREYWGGALFFLLADVEIRERTNNRVGLRDALRAMVRRAARDPRWTTLEVLETGDEAVGVPVLSELYRRHALASEDVDLDELWRRLGVRPGPGAARFDDDAPLAHIRRAITAKS